MGSGTGEPHASVSLAALLFVLLVLLVPALVATMAVVRRAQLATGPGIAARRPGLWSRRVALVGPQAIVLALVLMHGDPSEGPAAECLLLGMLLGWLAPGADDAVLGETGVQRGWSARRFEDLEEWRLGGEHLRFRLHGEWSSVPCPLAEMPRVRETLLAVNPARESRPAR